MAIEVITKDCSSLSDAEFAEMADLEQVEFPLQAGLLSKQADEWVLNSQARRDGVLCGFTYSTLERIGGTPALLLGLALIKESDIQVLRALMHDQFHKARMAFPDEDVVVAARLVAADPFVAFAELDGVRPWPDTRVNGEERAWGRRLAARYQTTTYDDRTMTATGPGERLIFDYRDSQSSTEPGIGELFSGCKNNDGFVIAWGWALAEYLDGFLRPVS